MMFTTPLQNINSLRQRPDKHFYHNRYIRWKWISHKHRLAFHCNRPQMHTISYILINH